ncbi:MAG: hypothetical protein ACRDRW_05860 [Pseudonocardiaceae bacterium]
MQPAGEGVSFLEAAQQGMFAIDTEAAGQIMKSIEQIKEALAERLMLIHNIKHEKIPLGDLNEAQAIATLDALVASGDQQSLDFVLWRFGVDLDNLCQVVEICMRTYEQVDAQAGQSFPLAGEG